MTAPCPEAFMAGIRHKHGLWPPGLQQTAVVGTASSGFNLWYGCHPNESTNFLRTVIQLVLYCDRHQSNDLEVKSHLLPLKPLFFYDFNRLWNFKPPPLLPFSFPPP